MQIQQVKLSKMATFCYLVVDEASQTCALIDPAFDTDQLIGLAVDQGLTITHVINTHNHSDHTAGNAAVIAAEPCRDVGLLGDEIFDLQNDPAHCGDCTTVCSYANATPLCAGGICQMGPCNAGFANVDGNPVRSCAFPVSAAAGMSVTTIEGLSADGNHPVQQAWRALNVPQCGYCQVGQMMMAAAMLKSNDDPSDEDINREMWNICRCGTYSRIRAAIKSAAKEVQSK